ncbi:MAG: SMC-Scp complex subunit ScpB [Spirochaetales bacterium]|jgi:segregation and condensation protein B|nr:SMC-Scp complex subunit ScpB [Spirochaetales bacterium]
MSLETETALIEAILFLETDPIDGKTLCRASDLPQEAVDRIIAALREKYAQPEHGIELLLLGGGYIFSPKKELWEFLKNRYGKKNDNRLSRAALETLSIIAYRQPITRAEIHGIRGYAPDNMLTLLMERSLIRKVGKKEDAPGQPQQYGTTKEFLKLFRLGSIADLPKLEEHDMDRFALN